MMHLSTNKIIKKLKNSSRIKRFTRREAIQKKAKFAHANLMTKPNKFGRTI